MDGERGGEGRERKWGWEKGEEKPEGKLGRLRIKEAKEPGGEKERNGVLE